MTIREVDRFHLMKLVEEKRLTFKKAAEQLGISLRQTMRIWKRYKIEGKKGIISQRRGKPAPNKISHEKREKIAQRLHDKYDDFGPTFAAEKLAENENIQISRESLRKIMIAESLWIPKKKKTLKVYQRRTRRSRFGELIQIDGSYEYWFEDREAKCCLLVFVDDATSRIVEMRFCKHESTQDYLESLKRYLKRHGKPCTLYSDKHSVFRVNREENLKGKRITQFGRVLKDLDIELICAHSPQAKGKVERANGVLQDRLIKEMRLEGISSMEAGNLYLKRYMKKYNKKFGKEPLDKEDAHRPVVFSDKLEEIMSIQEKRKLSKELSFQYKGTIYQIKADKPSYRMQYAHITIIDDGSGKIKADYQGQHLPYEKWDELPIQGKIVDSKALNWIDKKITKPKKRHPWR